MLKNFHLSGITGKDPLRGPKIVWKYLDSCVGYLLKGPDVSSKLKKKNHCDGPSGFRNMAPKSCRAPKSHVSALRGP